MPTWYARSFFVGVAIVDQEVFFSGTGFWTRLYRIRGSWGSFLTQLGGYRFQYTTHNAVLGSGIGIGRVVAIGRLEIESVGVKGIGLIYGD